MKGNISWKHRFFGLSIGQIFSIIGSSAAHFAIIWWLTVSTNSAVTLSVAALVGYLPAALLGPFVGAWVDRLDRKKVMIISDCFIALVSAGLAAAFAMGVAETWVIYLALFLRALGSAFHTTAYQAVIPAFVPAGALVKAGGWGQMVSSGASLLGPIIGALLMGITSLEVILLVDIIGAAFAVLSLIAIKIPEFKAEKAETSVLGNISDGFKLLRKDKIILTLLPALAVTVIFANPVFSIMPLMVTRHFGGGAWHGSIAKMVVGLGVLLGSMLLGLWAPNKKQFLLMGTAIFATGTAVTAAGLMPSHMFIPFVAMIFLAGLVNSAVNVPLVAYIQKSVPQNMVGKMLSLVSSVLAVGAPVGMVIAGLGAEFFGVAQWYAISGTVIFAAAVYIIMYSFAFDRQNDAGAITAKKSAKSLLNGTPVFEYVPVKEDNMLDQPGGSEIINMIKSA